MYNRCSNMNRTLYIINHLFHIVIPIVLYILPTLLETVATSRTASVCLFQKEFIVAHLSIVAQEVQLHRRLQILLVLWPLRVNRTEKIAWCQVRTIGRMCQYLSVRFFRSSFVATAVCARALSWRKQTPLTDRPRRFERKVGFTRSSRRFM